MRRSNSSIQLLLLIFLAFAFPSCQKVDLKYNSESSCGSNTICLKLKKASAEADGISVIKVIAYIPSISDKENRTITFSSNTGIFKSEPNQQNPEVIVDSSGKAETELTVGTIPGQFTVTATVKVGEDEFTASESLTLTIPTFSIDEIVTL